MAKIEALIFDMDGTLLDNMKWHIDAWHQTVQNHFPGFRGNVEDYFGMKNDEIFRSIAGDPNLSPERVQYYEDEKESLYQRLYEPVIEAGRGLIKLLEYLKKNGIPAAIATSAPENNLSFVLRKLDFSHYFEACVHSGMIGPGKPNPEIFLKSAALLQVEPANCLVFEDSKAGLLAADKAGMKSIRINWQDDNAKPILNEQFVAFDFEDERIYGSLKGE